jgi:hypothetical protein
VLAALGASLLVTALFAALAYLLARPPDGPPLATRDIRSGEPFEIRVPSNGKPLRVWLDMRCDSCAFPVEGKIELSQGGRVFAGNEISAGDNRDRAWGGHSRTLEQHLVYDADEQPAGDEITAKGTLTVPGPRDGITAAPVEGAPGPKLTLFRLTVTN